MKHTVRRRILCGLVDAVLIFLVYWFQLPSLYLADPALWTFVFTSLVIVFVVGMAPRVLGSLREFSPSPLLRKKEREADREETGRRASRFTKGMVGAMIALVALAIIGYLTGLTIFNASRYKDLITTTPGDFTADVAELSMDQIPVVDRDTAIQLGKRKLGEMSDLVSQFEIAETYTQINLHGRPVRVTPLAYADIIKWFTNKEEGIPAYIQLDMVTQETSLVRLEEGMTISPSEPFFHNLERYARFRYPTKMFDTASFEVDEEGTPYWILSTIQYRIGLWGGKDIDGAILINAVTGEHQYYPVDKIPTWVDRVYDANLIIEQLDYNGKFQSGFWNAHFGQKGVLRTTTGYNYIAVNDDVYLYTGMTSVTGDQSNVGFVLVNMRTKETKFYAIPGAEEYSAMRSAEGQVQNLKYTATFPLLLNVADRPTYFLSLKDGAGLVKMYAFVNVESYNVVGTGDTVAAARSDYIKKIGATDTAEITAVIREISSAVVDGDTQYYLRLEGQQAVYVASIEVSALLPFYKAGDAVTLSYGGGNDQLREVTEIRAAESTAVAG